MLIKKRLFDFDFDFFLCFNEFLATVLRVHNLNCLETFTILDFENKSSIRGKSLHRICYKRKLKNAKVQTIKYLIFINILYFKII